MDQNLWAGDFGNDYNNRNCIQWHLRLPFFEEHSPHVSSVCEVGANTGHNLKALAEARGVTDLSAVEINREACVRARELLPEARIYCGDFLDKSEQIDGHELVLSCGFLIHVRPELLVETLRRMISISTRYLLVMEWFSHRPKSHQYRKVGMIHTRDFGQDLLSLGMSPISNGFLWKETNPGWDNVHWWLMEKP